MKLHCYMRTMLHAWPMYNSQHNTTEQQLQHYNYNTNYNKSKHLVMIAVRQNILCLWVMIHTLSYKGLFCMLKLLHGTCQ